MSVCYRDCTMLTRQDVGSLGEKLAEDYLLAQGYTVLATHARASLSEAGKERSGEVDLVCRAPEGMLVFAEVKTRTSIRFGGATEAVDARKLGRVMRAAKSYRSRNQEHGPWRIDVVAITLSAEGELINLDHIKDVTL